MDKKIEQPTEQFEEFDYLSDFYFPFKEVEDRYSSPILKRMRENEIDPYEFLEIEKVEGTGVVKRITDKADLEEGKKTFGQSFIDFMKDAPEAAAVSTAEAGVNLSNNLVQLFGAGSNAIFKGTKRGNSISEATTEFAQGYNKSSEEIVAKLTQYVEDNDVNGVSQLMTDIGIDIAATIPIQRMLKKTGVPSYVATPLSFGLVYGMTGGDEEAENNMFIDSETIHGLNEILGVLPDTPESEIAELVATTFEGTAWGAIGDRLIKVFKVLKNNVPAYMNPQTSATMGGSAIAGEGALQIQELEEEKKTLNFSEDNPISSPMPGDDEMASAGLGPVFRSILKETAKKLSNKGSGEQFLGQLKNTPGLKQQELKWSGLDDFLKNKKNVTKEEVKDYLEKNSLDVSEVKLPRQVKTDPKADELYKNLNEDYGKLFDELGTLPQNQGRMVNPFNYTLTNVIEDGRRVNEAVSMSTLDNIFIGQRLNTYIPPTKMMSKGKYYDKSKLIDDFGKEGDANTLEFYMFENNRSGRMTAVRKIDVEDYANKEDPFSGGKFEFSYKTEMNIKEAEMYMIMKIRDKLERVVARNKDLGKTKFSGPGYVEPGGKDYKELIFKLKGDKDYPVEIPDLLKAEPGKATPRTKKTINYTSPNVHFGTKNEFAHVRFKTRDLNGQKVLTVEEMQSDLVQDMKQYGTVDFPFKNNWYELVTKRLIRYAADNDFDAVAIPKGSTIASRYKQKIVKKDGKISGSGKGKAELYDLAIPSYMKKYAKKWNAKVYDEEMDIGLAYGSEGTGTMPVTIIQLTDDMKKSVQKDGQALFEIFGIGSATAVGANAVSDNIENNIISQKTN
ncbi:hypothetical protein [uncultured Mediterranean phage uvMED]|jgi:hypothetical protein|nr:hypothetical protein [uncultured Mediterranean phage uvMED]